MYGGREVRSPASFRNARPPCLDDAYGSHVERTVQQGEEPPGELGAFLANLGGPSLHPGVCISLTQ